MSNRNSPSDGVTGAAMESLEDFKRKLDSEHTTVSAKLDQGVRARQELQELKGKLVEDLESSRKSLQARVEKVEAKLGATSKLKRNKEDQARLPPRQSFPPARFHPPVFATG
jgi:chromosome segregation ATPase